MTRRDEASDAQSELARALSVTRRVFDGESERASDTERRILDSMQKTRRSRRVFWVVPLAATFLVSAAFAEELGERLSEIKAQLFGDAVPVEAARPSSAPRAQKSSPVSESPPPIAAEPNASAEPLPTEPVPAPRAASAVPTVPRMPSSVTTTEAVDELTLYKDARHAHFVEGNFTKALAGWDRYLSRAPAGTFALEARYNRAIALYRLGRRTEAIEALRPFAEGAYGRYRRDEARELIDELR
jgi:TolA-binding protein